MSVVTDCGKLVNRSRYCVMKCKYDEKEYGNISFHSFPTNERKRQLWIEAINKKNWVPPKNAKICSLHFESRYIDRFYGKATLRNLAIPTIFEHGNETLVRDVQRKYYSEIVKPLEPPEGFRDPSNIPIIKEVTPSVNSVNLADIDKRSINTIPLSSCVTPDIPTIFDNYDNHYLEEHKYTTEIEILDNVDIKSENGCSPSHVDAEDLQYNEEKIFAAPIDIIDEKLEEIPDSGIDNQYRAIDYHEPTSTILTDLKSCCRWCLGALTNTDIQCLSVLNFDEIPINLKELNISIDDGLPQRICGNCCQVFEVIKIFIQQAKRSQEFLRKHLSTTIQIQNDPLDKIAEELSNKLKDKLDNGTSSVVNEAERNTTNTQDCLEVDVSDAETIRNSETKITVNLDRYCEICDKTFSQKAYKIKHMELHMDTTFTCDICGTSHNTKSNIKRHMYRNHLTTIMTCPTCNATFTKPDRYKYHLKTHNPDKKYKCQYCEKSFLQSHHLSDHENHHTGVKPYLCFVCGARFRNAQQYNWHIDKHNGKMIVKRTARNRPKRKQPVKDVTSPSNIYTIYGRPINSFPTYNCHICSATFRLPSSLKNHLNTHNEGRNHKCTICSISFKRYAHLQSHIRFVHLKERRFKCDVCGRRFALHGGLAEHMTTHSDERPFQCELCPEKYRTNRSLIRHIRTHTGEKPMQCLYCDKSFASYGLLIVHNLKHADLKVVTDNTLKSC